LHPPEMFLQTAVFSVPGYDLSLIRETTPLLKPPFLINCLCDPAGSGQGLRAPPGN
jgi:hypothetical protein